MAVPARSAPLSGNAVIDGLMLGGAWSGPTITYGFMAGDMNRNGIPDFDEGDWKDFHRSLVANVESFANVTFREIDRRANINFRLDEGGGGESGVPVQGTIDVETAVGIDPDVAGSAAVVRLGVFSETWFHELGHALGLKHTHDDEDGAFPKLPGVEGPGDQGTTYLNSQIYTVMGYTYAFLGEDNPFTAAVDFGAPVNAQPGSFGAIDIAALQHLYGARAHNAGNQTYRFDDDVDFNHGYTTIWDTGGVDTIAYAGTSRSEIDLRAATLENEIGGGGWVSTSETLTGGFTIAHGVTIENASGNGADDILIGNDGANLLSGLGGDDTLIGNAGDDRLDGGAGRDTMIGGTGNDTYVVDDLGDSVAEFAGEGIDTVRTALQSYTLGADIENLTYAGGRGFSGIGNGLSNRLTGGTGHDCLDGRAGADTMQGGAGSDTYVVDDAGDVVVEVVNAGKDRVLASISYTLTDNVEELSFGTSAKLDGTGNALANTLTGNAGANVLDGRGGADTLTGRGGVDTFTFRLGETQGDRVTDFTGAGTGGGDVLAFLGFGSNAVLTRGDAADSYTITADAAHGGTSETFRLVGVTDLDLFMGPGRDDVLLFA